MTEYDWIKTIKRYGSPLNQTTIGCLADWLRERGDPRAEKIESCRMPYFTDNFDGYYGGEWTYIGPLEPGFSWCEQRAIEDLRDAICDYLINTEPE